MRTPLRATAPSVLLFLAACGAGGGGSSAPALVDPGASTVQLSTGTVVASGVELVTVTVTVISEGGAPLVGRTVQLASSGANNVIVQPPPTDAAGVTSGTLASILAESKTIAVTVDPGGANQVLLTQTPSALFVGDPDTIDPAQSSAVAVPAVDVIADGLDFTTVTVTARDVNGNPVAGQSVQLAATGSNNIVFQPPQPTDTSGVAAGMLATTSAELKTISATINPGPNQVVVTQQASAEFTGDPSTIDAGNTSVAASPATDVVADGVEASTLTATVRDVFGNPVKGQTVSLSSSGGSNTIAQPPAVTDASGVATATIASTLAEIKTVTATVNPGPGQVVATQQPTVGFIADVSTIDAGLSTAAASPGTGVVADGVEVSTVTITVYDANLNPVAGQVVQLTASGSGNTLVQPGVTDASGQASGTLASTKAELKTVSATINPGPGQVLIVQQPSVGFIADASNLSAAFSVIAALPSANVVANGAALSSVTVTVVDVNLNPVPGQSVQLSASGSSNALTQPPAVTDASGQASGTLASLTAETKLVTAVVNPGPGQVALVPQAAVGFVGDPGTIHGGFSAASASPTTDVIADGVELATVTITVLDANLNPVAGQTVQLAASGSANTLTQPGPTDASGQTSGTLASTTAELKTITATINPGPGQVLVAQQPTVTFIGDASTIHASFSSAVATPALDVVADGVELATITVTVRDVNLNPVSGQLVMLFSSGSNNTLTQPLGVTDLNGRITGALASTMAELKTLVAAVNPGPGVVLVLQQPTAAFIGDETTIQAALSTVVASPAADVVANDVELSTVTVTVRDIYANPVKDQTVRLAATGGGNTLIQPGTVTDPSGLASGTLASTVAELKTLTATINPGPGQVVVALQPSVTFIADVTTMSATSSSAAAVPLANVVADDVELSTVSVTVVDAFLNPVPGRTVQLASSGSGNTLVQPAPTDASGQTSGTIRSTRSELKTLTVTVDPGAGQVVLAQQPTVEFIADVTTIDALTSSAAASPSVDVVANGTELSTVTVTVRDFYANPVPGQSVQLAASGASNTLAQPPAVTDASGRASGTLATTLAELKTLTATINPGPGQVVVTQQPSVTFIGDPATIQAAASTVGAVPSANVVANGSDTSTVTVTLFDVNLNPVPYQTVQLSSTGTGNTLGQPALTDASGQTAGTLASTAAEAKTLTATVNPGPGQVVLSTQPGVGFIADVSTIASALSTAGASPAVDVVADGVQLSTITVTVVDANLNPVPGQTVQLAATGANNTLTQPPAVTDASGRASGTLASTTAELKTLSATINPGPAQVVLLLQPSVAFIGDASTIQAGLSSTTAAPATGVVADGLELSTVTVTVRDVNSNPVSGQTVQLAATGAGNTLTQPPAPTDANGQTSGTLASTAAELKTLTATVDPGPGQVVVTQQPTVDFIADVSTLSAGLSSATASPSTNLIANGVDTSTVTVTVVDANSNPVAGQIVQLAATGSGNTLAQPPAVTDASGQASGTLATTISELKTLTATINPGAGQVVVLQQPSVTFLGDVSATSSAVSVDPATFVAADGLETATITVTVLDGGSNPIPGQVVQLACSGTGNTLTQPSGPTDAAGVATATIASTAAERKTLTATVNPGPVAVTLAQRPEVDFMWNPASVFYVRQSGTDPLGCGGGTTPMTAWRTIGKAASCVAPGDTVYVGAGTYFETVAITTSGAAGSPIRFVADFAGARTGDPGDVIVDAGGAPEVFHLDGVSWIEVEGFTIVGSVAGAPPAGGIRLGDGVCTDITLRGNAFYDNVVGIYARNASDVVIERSVLTDGWVLGDGVLLSASTGVTVSNNLIYDNAARGVALENASVAELYGNTLYGNGGDQVEVADALSAITIRDNLIVLGGQDGIAVAPGATVLLSYNDVWGNAALDYDGTAAGVGDISADPLLEDPDGADGVLGGAGWVDDAFQLGVAPPSPALDAGSAAAASLASPDGLTYAQRTTRVSEVLDGSGVDGAPANLGYHYSVAGDAPPALESGDARLFYGEGAERTLRWRAFDDSVPGWGFEASLAPTEVDVRYVETALSPLNSDEQLIGILSDAGGAPRLDVLSWSGAQWRRDFAETSPSNSDHRGFDLAFERASGEALAVWAGGSIYPRYRTRVDGAWSDPLAFGFTPSSGVVQWVELVPRAGTDEIALAYSDDNDELVVAVWDGTQWSTPESLALDLTTFAGSGEVDNRVFDLAWESTSGDLLAAFGRAGLAGFWWSLRPAGGVFGAASNVASAPGYAPNFIDLATEPGADRIALAAYDHDGTERFGLAVWDGGAWVNAGQHDTFSPDLPSTGPGDLCAAVGWVGTSGVAVCLFVDDDTGGLDWARWEAAGGWVVQPDEPVTGMGAGDSVRLLQDAANARVLAFVSDAAGKLFAASYDGASWTVETPALETSLSSTVSAPFDAVAR